MPSTCVGSYQRICSDDCRGNASLTLLVGQDFYRKPGSRIKSIDYKYCK